MKIKVLIIAFLTLVACSNNASKTAFPKEALEDVLIMLDGSTTTLGSVLEKYKGKTIVIDVWASWCSDCIKGLPLVKALQEQVKEDDAVFVFLSLDKKQASWKRAIEKRNIIGDHYFVSSGWDGPFGESINVDWIPRYMVIGKDGNIKLYKAVKANDIKILEAIKADKL